MKILPIPLLLLSVSFTCSFAQKAPIKAGDIPIEDLKMVRYDKDSSAAAVMLADYGSSEIVYSEHTGFSVVFDRIVRIKILTKEGMDWATFSIPLYHEGSSDEKVTSLKGYTYNLENNKVVETKLKSDGIFKEKSSENWNSTKFTLPNVKQGSIVEVSYRITSDFIFNFQDWQFQHEIPCRWSEYRTRVPEYFIFEKYMQGYVQLDANEITPGNGMIFIGAGSDQERVNYNLENTRMIAKNVVAFKAEPFTSASRDYISKIQFELATIKLPHQPMKSVMGSWADINNTFSESSSFGMEISGNNFLKKTTEGLIAGAKTPEEQIAAIYQYVKNNVEWNGVSTKYPASTLKKILEDKKGNSADINMLMASMLEKAGIKVNAVLISTRDHGLIRTGTPVSTQFNYFLVLAKAGEKSYLLDGTDRLLPIGALPERCLNGQGIVIAKEGFSWIPLKTPTRSRSIYSVDLSLTPEGALTGKLQLDRSGYFASSDRRSYLKKGESEYLKDLVSGKSWTLAKSEFVNTKEISESFKEIHELTVSDHVVTSDAVMYVNPFLAHQEKENPFKTENRVYPVDFGSPSEKIYIAKFKIPDGYAIDEIPQSKVLTLPNNAARYTYSMAQNAGVITLTSHLIINNSIFTQLEYPNLREFYAQVVAKQTEQIVLKKK